MKKDEATQKPKAVHIDCPHCGAKMRVIPGPAHPVKLPAGCPCCLRHIYSYTLEQPHEA